MEGLSSSGLSEETLKATERICPLSMYDDDQDGEMYEQCLKDATALIESKKNNETTIQAQQIGLAVGLPASAGLGGVTIIPVCRLLKIFLHKWTSLNFY